MESSLKQIAGNPAVDRMIKRCFELLDDTSAERVFRKKFKSQRSDNWQVMNTYRELLIGGVLSALGCKIRYEQELDGQRPDWCGTCASGTQFIADVVTHYVDQATFQRLEQGAVAFVDEIHNVHRLLQSIEEKNAKYAALCEQRGVALVVAVGIEFSSTITPELLEAHDDFQGLLCDRPTLSGVLFLESMNATHRVVYLRNSSAKRPFELPPKSEFVW